MENLREKIAKLAIEFRNRDIPYFNELFHENPTTYDLEMLITNETL